MGCGPFRGYSFSSYEKPTKPVAPNPDPNCFIIEGYHPRGDFLLLKVRYPGTTTFEGLKILLYKGVTIEEIVKQKTLDPHFSSNKEFFSPIARFEPTPEGIALANVCMGSIYGE